MFRSYLVAKHGQAKIFLAAYLLLALFTILFFNGTGDSGDSILHYLFARYAPAHPELFFNHWAKPLFVFLACPFAQFGIIGIKLFNVLAGVVAMWFAYKSAQLLNLKYPVLVMVFMLFAPLYYILTFSGLTELLFAALLSLATYLALKNKLVPALLLASFLPYVRSEGLIVIGVFGLWLLMLKHYRYLALLAVGSLVYNIAGLPFQQKALWVVSEIPYSHLSSNYGKGNLTHFAIQLVNVLGIPVYALLIVGVATELFSMFMQRVFSSRAFLVTFVFVAFFTAHTLFWYFGIFNSMGLKRVFLAVMPVMALLALIGFNKIEKWLNGLRPGLGNHSAKLLVCYVLIFPFTPNPAAVNWQKDLVKSSDEVQAEQAAAFIKNNTQTRLPVLYAYHYLSEALQIDHFDKSLHREFSNQEFQQMKPGQLLVWDAWFMPVEKGLPEERLSTDTTLQLVFRTSSADNKLPGNFSIYQKK